MAEENASSFLSLVFDFQLPSNLMPARPPFTIKYNGSLYPSATPTRLHALADACLDDTVLRKIAG